VGSLAKLLITFENKFPYIFLYHIKVLYLTIIKNKHTMTYSKIITAINNANLSADELSKLNSFVVDTIKLKRKMDGAVIKQSLSAGSVVMVDHPAHKNSTFEVLEVRRTKATIKDSQGRRMNAPLSMLIPM
jgi:hypothetical protein